MDEDPRTEKNSANAQGKPSSPGSEARIKRDPYEDPPKPKSSSDKPPKK